MAISAAVRRLVDEELIPKMRVQPREKLRKRQFFTKDVNSLLVFNEEPLQFAFNKFATAGTKTIQQAKAVTDILGTIFKIGPAKAQVIYARSKMTIPNEKAHFESYKKMKYVEFLEMLCRVTHYIFKSNPAVKIPFHKKLEYILDQLLWRVGLHRNDPKLHWMPPTYDSEEEDEDDDDASAS